MSGVHSLARWGGVMFIGAGALMTGSVLLKGIAWFSAASPPEGMVLLLAVPGLLATLGGLLGLYPILADASPWMSRAGLVSTGIAGIGLVVTVAWSLSGELLAAVTGGYIPVTPPEVAFLSLVAALAVAGGLFGVGSVRAAGPWRRLGLFLLGYAATYGALLAAGVALGTAPDWLYFIIYGAQPVLLLATGVHLRQLPVSVDRELPADTTVAG